MTRPVRAASPGRSAGTHAPPRRASPHGRRFYRATGVLPAARLPTTAALPVPPGFLRRPIHGPLPAWQWELAGQSSRPNTRRVARAIGVMGCDSSARTVDRRGTKTRARVSHAGVGRTGRPGWSVEVRPPIKEAARCGSETAW